MARSNWDNADIEVRLSLSVPTPERVANVVVKPSLKSQLRDSDQSCELKEETKDGAAGDLEATVVVESHSFYLLNTDRHLR